MTCTWLARDIKVTCAAVFAVCSFFNLLFKRQKKNKRFKKTNRKTTLGSVRLWQEKQITILCILLHTDV